MPSSSNTSLARASLEAAYLRLERPLFNVLLRWVWSREEAMDVMHEAFEKVWRRRASVDETTLDPLLWTTALNLAANRRRANKLRTMLGLDSPSAPLESSQKSSDEQVGSAQVDQHVRKAIDALPEKLRVVVVMCELSGLSYETIAKTLAIPIGTVGSRRSAAMQRLEQQLQHLKESP